MLETQAFDVSSSIILVIVRHHLLRIGRKDGPTKRYPEPMVPHELSVLNRWCLMIDAYLEVMVPYNRCRSGLVLETQAFDVTSNIISTEKPPEVSLHLARGVPRPGAPPASQGPSYPPGVPHLR